MRLSRKQLISSEKTLSMSFQGFFYLSKYYLVNWHMRECQQDFCDSYWAQAKLINWFCSNQTGIVGGWGIPPKFTYCPNNKNPNKFVYDLADGRMKRSGADNRLSIRAIAAAIASRCAPGTDAKLLPSSCHINSQSLVINVNTNKTCNQFEQVFYSLLPTQVLSDRS